MSTKQLWAVDEEEKGRKQSEGLFVYLEPVFFRAPAGLLKDQKGRSASPLAPCPHQISARANKWLDCPSSRRCPPFSLLTFRPWTLTFHPGKCSAMSRAGPPCYWADRGPGPEWTIRDEFCSYSSRHSSVHGDSKVKYQCHCKASSVNLYSINYWTRKHLQLRKEATYLS